MSKKVMLLVAVLVSASAFAACNDTTSNTNANANANANTGTVTTRTQPTATPTPRYTEEQAREEREPWIHTKIVAKLIGDTQTPERKINVDVVAGAVTLRGEIDTAEAKAEAERVAKETDGVKKVTNQLKVVPPAKATNSNKPAAKGKTP